MALDETTSERPHPSPLLSPAEVIGLQLHALGRNDAPHPDAGIATAFGFASPENQAVTGPLERFTELVHNPTYRAMLNFRAVQRGTVQITGSQAQESILLLDANGKTAVFVFALSKQAGGPYDGCWMTDAVLRA